MSFSLTGVNLFILLYLSFALHALIFHSSHHRGTMSSFHLVHSSVLKSRIWGLGYPCKLSFINIYCTDIPPNRRASLSLSFNVCFHPSFGDYWVHLILFLRVSRWVLTTSVNVGGRNAGQQCMSSQQQICSNICWVLFWVCGQKMSSRLTLLKLGWTWWHCSFERVHISVYLIVTYSAELFYGWWSVRMDHFYIIAIIVSDN